MKDNSNTEIPKEKIKALRHFLGFPEEPGSGEGRKFLFELQKLKDKSIISEKELKASLEIIKARLREDSGHHRGKSDKKLQKFRPVLDRLFPRRFLFPAFSLTFIIFTILLYFFYFTEPFSQKGSLVNESFQKEIENQNTKDKVKKEEFFLKLLNAGDHAAHPGKRLDLTRHSFSSGANVPVQGSIGTNLVLWFRGVRQWKAEKSAQGMIYSFDRGTVLLSYNNTTGIPLEIRMPRALVRVRGTEFMVSAQKNGDLVLVRKGLVEVIHGNRKIFVTENCFWQSGNLSAKKIQPPVLESFFHDFKNRAQRNFSVKKFIEKQKMSKTADEVKNKTSGKESPEARAKAANRIILKNGDLLTGRILRQNAKSVIFQTSLDEILEIQKSEIKETR
jgi:hypothetical protein